MWDLFLKIFFETINWGVILCLLFVIIVLGGFVYVQKDRIEGLEKKNKDKKKEIRDLKNPGLKDRKLCVVNGIISISNSNGEEKMNPRSIGF